MKIQPRLSRKQITVLLALGPRWQYETDIVNVDCEYKSLWLLDMYGFAESRAKLIPNFWHRHSHGLLPSQCQWKLTRAGMNAKKNLQKQGWYLS